MPLFARLLPLALIILTACAPTADVVGDVPTTPLAAGILSPTNTPTGGTDKTGLGLHLPVGWAIETWTGDLPGVRDLVGPDATGNFWVSQPREGTVRLIEVAADGSVTRTDPIFRGLNAPHGLALSPDGLTLYVAEADAVSSAPLYTEGQLTKLADLPAGGRHDAHSLVVAGDRLYVKMGSSCDTCVEEDPRRATVYVMDLDGSNFRSYATGLRNAPFFAIHPTDGRVFVTEMGRDFLGDDLPPDEINVLTEGAHYGWPWCYGDRVRDTTFSSDARETVDCSTTTVPVAMLPAHSAPLGLAFVPAAGWPADTVGDLLVALHGSWNRTTPTGYKLIRLTLDDAGRVTGAENVITGWLDDGEKKGRPVDILTRPGGIAYLTDDERGVIYRITAPGGNAMSDLIRVASPTAEAIVTSPLVVTGEARGTWYFEASFPVRLVDGTGQTIIQSHAEAQSDWMTEQFVPFRSTLTFPKPSTPTGELVLEKDNPSGLPEHAAEIRMPVRFE